MQEIGHDDSSEFARRVSENQARLTAKLRAEYDFIVCGAGASGSVVARRLAENPDVHVLLIEAGGSDDAETVPILRNGRSISAASGIGASRPRPTRTSTDGRCRCRWARAWAAAPASM